MTKSQSGSRLKAPEPLRPLHDVSRFNSGTPDLDEWLRRRALLNDASGASKTYVVTQGRRVVGFYSLATGSVARDAVPGRIRRNMPDPIPVILIGRLAVESEWREKGIGAGMLRDAVRRILTAAEIVGIRAILVHAATAEAKSFYEHHGFRESSVNAMTLMITLADARSAISD